MQLKPSIHRYRLVVSAWLLAYTGTVSAQTLACDQGVIRLPDRTGTVQICSTIAAQVPALSKQLGEAVKLLGSQQQQIKELTRLVRAINGSGAGLDEPRQLQMLRNLSAELSRAERQGPDATRRTVEELGEQFEGLSDQLVQALSRPTSSAAAKDALRGRLGDSIAQLELRSAARQLDEIAERLKQVQADLGTVKTGVAQANDKLDKLAAVVDPSNPSERCASLECAILGTASVETVRRLVDNGARLPGVPQMAGMFVMGALTRPPADREALLALLLRAGLDPQVRMMIQTSDSRFVTEPAARLAEDAMKRIGEAGTTSGPASAANSTGNWNKLGSCLYMGNEGVSLSELASILGDDEFTKQVLRLGFAPPRATLSCRSLRRNGGSVTIVIDAAGGARLLNGG